ncbi:LytTR family DNA-binding domain-containing protein [Chitinophaga sp. S165]|uniref:LytR/AlgR family response regulator transcription factor n=1 Tax=Chitinophaga sp. S165 TaxID=2135462 RepID=UPI000D71872C|nr:LytTR family DNA-binding domain-containing protein [Chitinophaga sp. S165]PWV55891.1 LytTR family two component transcriptional regulator [Chitinophaga sp. S165]
MKCIIVDDEPLAREEMQALIRDVSNVEVLGTFSNALTAMDFLKGNEVDLIFLDIEMPMVTGLEFAATLSRQVLTVFTTAYPQYAFKSYELDAIDYLLKPIDKSRLEKTISKAEIYKRLLSDETEKNVVEANTGDFLIIKSDRRFYRLNFNDIRFIEGLKDYVVIHTGHQKLITAMNLKTIHQKVAQQLFLRVSKSYVVNINYIDSFDHRNIYLGDTEIPIGEVYRKDFFRTYSGGALNPDE